MFSSSVFTPGDMPSRLRFASRPERLSCNPFASENGCAVERTAQAEQMGSDGVRLEHPRAWLRPSSAWPRWLTCTVRGSRARERARVASNAGFGKHALAPWGEGVIKPRSGAVNRYAHDISNLKYRDAREQPGGPMTRDQIEIWTLAIRDRTNGQS